MSTGFPDYSLDVSGTLQVPNGGTGTTSLTVNGVLVGNGAAAVGIIGPGAHDSILAVPHAGGTPQFITGPTLSATFAAFQASAAIPYTDLFSPPDQTLWLAAGYLIVKTAGTGALWKINLGWGDDVGRKNADLTGQCNDAALTNSAQGTLVFFSALTQTIQYTVIVSGVINPGTAMTARIALARLFSS